MQSEADDAVMPKDQAAFNSTLIINGDPSFQKELFEEIHTVDNNMEESVVCVQGLEGMEETEEGAHSAMAARSLAPHLGVGFLVLHNLHILQFSFMQGCSTNLKRSY